MRVAVLRPEPGNAATVARVAAAGLVPLALPLFAVRPLAWTPPDPAGFDALLLTSANAVRHAGPALARLAALPAWTVGEATARAAREAGLAVAGTGSGDAPALLAAARAAGVLRPLHLTGADTTMPSDAVAACAVYASEPIPVPAEAIRAVAGGVALLHSPRAARRWAALVAEGAMARASCSIAALSPAVCVAAGDGWAAAVAAPHPTDAALIAAAAALIDRMARHMDKPGP